MKALLCMALGGCLAWGGLTKPIASYDIKAKLDGGTHTITGRQTLTWVNDSPDTVGTLQFHLYMNAFKNSRSTFFKESGGQLRGDQADTKEWGWIDVRRMRVAGGADLTKAIRFIQADDGNKDDQTVIEVALPEPAKPGATIQVEMDFVTKLPKVFARTGFHGDFHLVGQWFPKLGVWETKGFRYSQQGAWNCHQFHANSEFYANFGDYQVELTVPSPMVIGATGGEPVAVRKNGAVTSYTFRQESVTDFVWTVQPTYRRFERMFTAGQQTTPAEIREVVRVHGISEADARLSDVKVILLMQPEHADQAERHFKAAESAIKWYGLWYGRYPFTTLTVVDPPHGGGGAGGMEYPTFITAGTSWRMPADMLGPEEVTVHEFGHQFWMQLVATNEFEESWLDEGFNSYSTAKVMQKVYGNWPAPLQVFGFNVSRWLGLPEMDDFRLSRAANVASPDDDSIQRRAWEYCNASSYSMNSYPRTTTLLRMLERVLGEDSMLRVMRTYQQRFRFKHPISIDFVTVVNEVSGRSMNWMFDQFVFGNKVLDYSVASVTSDEVTTPFGVFDQPGGDKKTVSSDDAEKQDEKSKGKKSYETVVKIRREGDAVAPVDVLVRFKDGSVEWRTWDGQYRWAKFTFVKPVEVERVEIDPQGKYFMDVNWSNDVWKAKPDKAQVARWLSTILFYAQNAAIWAGALL